MDCLLPRLGVKHCELFFDSALHPDQAYLSLNKLMGTYTFRVSAT